MFMYCERFYLHQCARGTRIVVTANPNYVKEDFYIRQ